MKKLIAILLTALLVGGCGGGTGFGSSSSSSSSSSSTTTTSVASVQVLASSPQLPSDNSAPVTITAYVLNAANQALEGTTVIFQTSSGYLNNITSVTDANGIATATLNTLSSDPSNRTITVTASAATVSDSIDVDVVGTSLTLKGASSVVQNASASYVATLTNAGGKAISGQAVTLTSSKGNVLSSSTLTTDSNGQITVTMTGTVAGTDTLSASALGLTSSINVAVSNDSFAFTTPASNTEITLNQSTPVSIKWTIGGVAQVGKQISFSTTRGTLSSGSALTDSAGVATVNVSSTNAGLATVTASTATGTSTTLPVEFVATTPASINLQASPASIATQEQSIITAVVRDAANNLVKNQTVNFTLADVTNGTLSVGSAITDSQGTVQTVYTASTTTSASDGVHITGTVASNSSVTDTADLTVGARQVFISLGTGKDIEQDDFKTQYKVPYAVQVTDSNGNPVSNVTLTMSVLSQNYALGERCESGLYWTEGYGGIFADEDVNRNGILDPGEDLNGSTRLEAGNIATVVSASSSSAAVTTDSTGFAHIYVVYPKEYAYWVYVTLSATTSVQGTETTRSVNFWLPGTTDDFKVSNGAAPGMTSPFGVGTWVYPNATDQSCS